jgi:hypothetical protein
LISLICDENLTELCGEMKKESKILRQLYNTVDTYEEKPNHFLNLAEQYKAKGYYSFSIEFANEHEKYQSEMEEKIIGLKESQDRFSLLKKNISNAIKI